MNEALSIKEAGREIGCGPVTVYKFVNSGALPAKKLGRKTLILRADLVSFLASLPSYKRAGA